jgi:hypothetical protein
METIKEIAGFIFLGIIIISIVALIYFAFKQLND